MTGYGDRGFGPVGPSFSLFDPGYILCPSIGSDRRTATKTTTWQNLLDTVRVSVLVFPVSRIKRTTGEDGKWSVWISSRQRYKLEA